MKKCSFFIFFFAMAATVIVNAQNIAVNTTGAAAAATNMFEVTQTSTTANTVGIYSIHSGAITGTGYGLQALKTGASTTNIGGYFSASGATNNYGIIVPSTGGNVGIGTSTPAEKLTVGGGGVFAVVNASVWDHMRMWSDGLVGYIDAGGANNGLAFRVEATAAGYPAASYADVMRLLPDGNVGIGITSPTAKLHIAQTVAATGALTGIVYTGAVNTNQTLSTEIPSLTLTTAGRQWATGALATQREVLITQPVYSFVGASTITDAATLGIAGAPVKSTNATITNTHGILVQAGAVSTATNSFGLTVNAQTGATNNYAAALLGGKVGIGTSAPNGRLHVYEPTGTAISNTAGSLILEHGDSGGQSGILFKSTVNTPSDYAYIKYAEDGSGNGSTSENGLLTIGVVGDVAGNAYQDDIAIMSSGNLGINTTTPLSIMHINGSAPTLTFTHSSGTNQDNTGVLFFSEDATSGFKVNYDGANNKLQFTGRNASVDSDWLTIQRADGNVGLGVTSPTYKLQVNGQPAANGYTAFTNYSDIRLKRNIENITSSLDRILQLRPVSFQYNENYLALYPDEKNLDKVHKGFIAQEVQKIFPEMVNKDPGNEYLDLDVSNLQVYLVRAIQEQQKQIEDFKTENQELKVRIEKLEKLYSNSGNTIAVKNK